MARKSRKQIGSNILTKPIPTTVGYIRLSVFNEDATSSIENQQRIIEQWAADNHTTISQFYIDNGYSGSTFERPAFQSLIQDIEDGKIECIIVKDLSRLGRDLISTGYYLECYFSSQKVRFVSVNDYFDTTDGMSSKVGSNSRIRIPLTNAFNEQTVLDIKRKATQSMAAKVSQGMFIGPRAPFGYVKDPENYTYIVPDAEAAAIVKLIFQKVLAGATITALVRYLNENHIPTPIQYARKKGLQGNYNDGCGTWNSRSVKYILTNRTYTGCLVQGKEKKVVMSTHEALIEQAEFDAVQNILQTRTFNVSSSETSPDNFLKGKVICACCGAKMQRKRGTNHADWYFYTCITKNRIGADRCTGMYIREEDVIGAIYHQLKLYLKENAAMPFQLRERIDLLNKDLTQHMAAMESTQKNPALYYERYIAGEIDRDTFLLEQNKIRNSQEYLETLKSELKICEEEYDRLALLQKASIKQISLVEICGEINRIVVDSGRRVVVKWNQKPIDTCTLERNI